MDQVKEIIIYIQFAIIFVLFGLTTCKKNTKKINQKEIIKTEIVKDTAYIERIFNHEAVFSSPIVIYRDSIIHDTIYKIFFRNDSNLQFVNVYNDSIVDSFATINYKAVVNGTMLDLKFNNKYKFPQYTNTTTKTIERQVKAYRNQLFMSTAIGGNKSELLNELSFGLAFEHKKGMIFGYRYNLLNESHAVEIHKRLF